jgi:hypothetical protein
VQYVFTYFCGVGVAFPSGENAAAAVRGTNQSAEGGRLTEFVLERSEGQAQSERKKKMMSC